MSSPKIALGWVRGDMVDGPFQDSVDNFLAFDSRDRNITIGRGFVKALYLDDKRNELVRDFLKTKADYLMMLDTDIEFESWQIYALLDEAVENGRHITTGLYFSWLTDGRLLPVWFSEVTEDGVLKVFGSFKPGEVIVPLAAAGMGFTLIRRDVFEIMARVPEWTATDWTWFGRDLYGQATTGQSLHQGEDCCFCVRAGKVGCKTWGHKGVVVGHWKKTRLDFNLFRALVELSKKEEQQY